MRIIHRQVFETIRGFLPIILNWKLAGLMLTETLLIGGAARACRRVAYGTNWALECRLCGWVGAHA